MSDPVVARGRARAPGTCGELAQGMLDVVLAMVTCPIDRFSTATVELAAGSGAVDGPADSPKAARAVELTLAELGRSDLDVRLSLDSDIPRGKGMASSTADILSAIEATAAALGERLSPGQQASLALRIEPSDGVMLPGIALFDHIEGRIARSLGQPPPIKVLALEFGGSVDTERYNEIRRTKELQRRSPELSESLRLIEDGLRLGDPELIGDGATLSAMAHQAVLPKLNLDAVIDLGRASGAVGVNVAHSGTVIGLLFADGTDIGWAAREALNRLPGLSAIHRQRLIGGGAGRLPESQV